MGLTLLLNALHSAGVKDLNLQLDHLVRMSLAFHNLNKISESKLGISVVQYHLLRTLKDMPACSPQNLAKAAGMHPSTLTQSMKRLLRKDYIFIGDDPKDSRKKLLALTFAGNEALSVFEEGIKRLLPSHREFGVSTLKQSVRGPENGN